MIRAALLDIDGTLLSSNVAHALSWVEALEQVGRRVPVQAVEPLIGMGGDKLIKLVAPGVTEDSDEGKEISSRRRTIFMHRYLPTLRPCDGARDLVLRMRAEGLELVIATSATGSELSGLLEQARIDDLIPSAVTKSDAGRSKPDPDIVHAALKKSGYPASQVLMVGDTPYDIEAARRAGVDTVAVRSGGWTDDQLCDAVAIYDDARDLLRHYAESPFCGAGVRRHEQQQARAAGSRR